MDPNISFPGVFEWRQKVGYGQERTIEIQKDVIQSLKTSVGVVETMKWGKVSQNEGEISEDRQ